MNIHTHTAWPGKATPNYSPYRCLYQKDIHRDGHGSTNHQSKIRKQLVSSDHRKLYSNKSKSTANMGKNLNEPHKHNTEGKKTETNKCIMHDHINIKFTN